MTTHPNPHRLPTDAAPAYVQEIDSAVEEMRERLCDRLDSISDRHGVHPQVIAALLSERQGVSYGEDYLDWTLDAVDPHPVEFGDDFGGDS